MRVCGPGAGVPWAILGPNLYSSRRFVRFEPVGSPRMLSHEQQVEILGVHIAAHRFAPSSA